MSPDRSFFDVYLFRERFGFIFHTKSMIQQISFPVFSPQVTSRKIEMLSRSMIKKQCGLSKELQDYMEGKVIKFTGHKPDLRSYTEFEEEVLSLTMAIPYGEVETYGSVAKKLGKPKASRAVGNALGKNMVPLLVPCHRVLGSNGLGGFSPGLDWKIFLLGLEKTGVNRLKVK